MPCVINLSGRLMVSAIAFSDKNGKVYVVTLADRKMVEIADAPHGQIRDYTWSPRGNYLAFSFDRILIVSQPSMSGARATASCARSRMTCLNAYSPRLGSTGQLHLLPCRSRVSTQISQIEFNYARTARLTSTRSLCVRTSNTHFHLRATK